MIHCLFKGHCFERFKNSANKATWLVCRKCGKQIYLPYIDWSGDETNNIPPK